MWFTLRASDNQVNTVDNVIPLTPQRPALHVGGRGASCCLRSGGLGDERAHGGVDAYGQAQCVVAGGDWLIG